MGHQFPLPSGTLVVREHLKEPRKMFSEQQQYRLGMICYGLSKNTESSVESKFFNDSEAGCTE